MTERQQPSREEIRAAYAQGEEAVLAVFDRAIPATVVDPLASPAAG